MAGETTETYPRALWYGPAVTRDPTRLREAMRRPPRPLEERLAQTYDDEVYPLWGARFTKLALDDLPAPIAGSVLELGCGAGQSTAELVKRHQGSGRIIALDATTRLIDQARVRLGADVGRRVFLRVHDPARRLPFGEETFDLVVCHGLVGGAASRAETLADLARVTAPGGQVVATLPLRGTWGEILDLFAEVLAARPDPAALADLAETRAAEPEGDTLADELAAAGLIDVTVEVHRWELLFRTGRELFYAPLVEQGPLPRWKAIAGRGDEMQEVFLALKEAIDTYYAGSPIAISVIAARISGRKPAAPAEAA